MAYNLASFLGWGYVLYKTVDHYAQGGAPADMYPKTGELTKWVQTGALLEILHAVLGFVRSPVGTTATQVFSRIMLVWGVMHLFPKPDVGRLWPIESRDISGFGNGDLIVQKDFDNDSFEWSAFVMPARFRRLLHVILSVVIASRGSTNDFSLRITYQPSHLTQSRSSTSSPTPL